MATTVKFLVPSVVSLVALLSAYPAHASSIGKITDLKGSSEVVRNTAKLPGKVQLPIEALDRVQTGNGRVEITFVDNSKVKVTEHSKLVIDSFVYDGNPTNSKFKLQFASGTVRFATGQLGKINKKNIDLRTPTATIAVRGTDFAATVDDFGKSLIVLLPEEDGRVGEITVSNAAGFVVINQAFQATFVSTADTAPSDPTILRLDLTAINNMMIVSPPENDDGTEPEGADSRANILDLDALDMDYLKNTSLDDNTINLVVLDTNPLDEEFLADELADPTQVKDTKDGVKIEGARFGDNAASGLKVALEGEKLSLGQTKDAEIAIKLKSNQPTTIIFNTKNDPQDVSVNGGGTVINVTQD